MRVRFLYIISYYCYNVLSATRDTILMTKNMADAGADAVLVVNPFYYKASMNNQALKTHFTKVR